MDAKIPHSSKNFVNYVLVGLLVVASFVIGSLYTKVQYLENGGAVAGVQTEATQQAQQPAQAQEPIVELAAVKDAFEKSHIKFGKSDSKLVFIEVADPSCPYCHAAGGHNPELSKQMGAQFTLESDGGTYRAPVVEMKKLLDEGKASFAYIYTNGHGNGELTTKALYCAYDEDVFWPVHDKLMTNDGYTLINEVVKNDTANTQQLVDFLSSVIDPVALKDCLDSGKYDDRLSTDSGIAASVGVSGTPGFFVNETKYAGAYSFKDMESTVQEALN